MRKLYPFLIIAIVAFSCKEEKKLESTQVATIESAAEINDTEWIYLFDEANKDGWREYNGEHLPSKWVFKDNVLSFDTEVRLEEERKGGSDIIYAAEEFDNFELYLEWQISEGGNSGIMYHIQEGDWPMSSVAPEYQLLDDENWEEINNATLEDWQKTAADYAMHTPNEAKKIVKQVGEWNSSRIIFTRELVTHYLNGKEVLNFVPWDAAWEQRKSNGKWKNSPKYGTFKSGYIGLQDHDSPLSFKNMKIKKIE